MLARRRFLQSFVTGTLAFSSGSLLRGEEPQDQPDPFGLLARFPRRVNLHEIRLLRYRGRIWAQAISEEGDFGISPTARQPEISSLFLQRVAPFFVRQDVRRIDRLVDELYQVDSNYKYAGMPFWASVGQVELAILDLLGRRAKLPVNELLGKPVRASVPVYISRFNRDNTAAEEVAKVAELLERHGAKACKLKIGRRMHNTPEQTKRDLRMIELARQQFGDEITIYVDANGSYNPDEAIRIGRELEKSGVAFFEEPCPWEDYEATKKVADHLEMDVAGGEQDSSWPRWRWMVENRGVDIVQPDVFYNGGLIRCLRVAQLAKRAGLKFTPHSPKSGLEAYPNLHLVSLVPNLGAFQEYRDTPKLTDGQVHVPTGPGLGWDWEDKDWLEAEVLGSVRPDLQR